MMENLARAHVLEFAGVLCKHLGRPRRQGRVDEYPRMRQTAGVDEHGNVEEQLLRPLKREYRDDEIAATRQRSLDFGFQERTPLLDRQILAGPVAISAFADHMVKPRRSFGIGVKRSEEHTSELQSLMRNSYAVFCLNTKKTTQTNAPDSKWKR